MKKLVLAVLAALAFTGAQAQAFPDIPANHWAGEAVQRIADLGIVIGFPDGTYRGNEGFTRYQAALVISRLLDVIRADMDAMKALTDADIASLRNALQELASDVAAQDVRLSAVEGAVASISDDTASNTARIEALEAAGAGGIDPAVLQDLQNQIDAARVAADTAQSTADAAADQAAQNAAAIDAINDLLALLNEDVQALGQPQDMSGLQGQVDRNTADIANIREFVILLRRDQVALRDRVAALEASDASQQAAIDDLTARVTAIEEDLFTISGTILLEYKAYRLSGLVDREFDSDRVWGLNADRNIGDSRFSSGEKDTNEKDGIESGNGEKKQDRQDIENKEGEVDATLTLNVGFGTARNGAGDPRALNTFETVIELGLTKVTGVGTSGGGALYTGTDKDVEISNPYVFSVKSFKSTFDPIGAAPLTFAYGEDADVEFTKYVFDGGVGAGDSEGFVATVGSPDFLAFLSPTLTIAYGEVDKSVNAYELETGDFDSNPATANTTRVVDRNADGKRNADDKIGDADIYGGAYYRAIRGTLSPLQGETLSATGGFSFAQLAMDAQDNADVGTPNQTVTVWGLDAQIGISVVDIKAEYASSSAATTPGAAIGAGDFSETPPVAAGNTVGDKDGKAINRSPARGSGQSLFYVTADVDVAGLGIPVLKTLSANYRMIPDGWDGLDDEKDYPFVEDQTGFGVKASLGLFILDPIDVYFQNYSTNVDSFGAAATDTTSITAFGVDAKVNLFAAFSISGFFHNASVDGAAVNSTEAPYRAEAGAANNSVRATVNNSDGDPTSVKRDTNYDTGFGVKLGHDGAAENALIPNLNIGAEYKQTEADFSKRTIDVNADYKLKVAIVELDPYAGFKSENDSDSGAEDKTTIKVGTGIKTDELGIIFKPSLQAAVNYRTTAHSDVPTNYTATELQWAVGVNFGEFLFANSTLSARYGAWTGTNVKGASTAKDSFGNVDSDTATNISDGDTFGTGTQSTSGYEIAWDYYDLVFTYGAYNNTVSGSTVADLPNNPSTGAQAFRIAYTVKF
jgi:S-layer homology domain